MKRLKSPVALAIGIVFIAGSAWAQGSPGGAGAPGAPGQPSASPGTTPSATDQQKERATTPGTTDRGTATTPGATTAPGTTDRGTATTPGVTERSPAATPGATERGAAGTMERDKDRVQKDRAQTETGPRARGATAGADREQVRKAQEALKDKGHNPGPVDGVMGPKTRAAVRDFQKQEGLKESGRLDQETLARLGIDARAGAADTASPAASPRPADQDRPAAPSASPATPGASPATPGAPGTTGAPGADKQNTTGQPDKK